VEEFIVLPDLRLELFGLPADARGHPVEDAAELAELVL
jgi:hypothetical protein